MQWIFQFSEAEANQPSRDLDEDDGLPERSLCG